MKPLLSKVVVIGCTALLLAACATRTPYQPMQKGQGYSEQKLEAGRYRVTVVGSTATPRETVENYLLYRAAELTVAAGYERFSLRDQQTDAEPGGSGSGVSVGVGGFGGVARGVGLGVGVGTGSGSKLAYRTQADVLMLSVDAPVSPSTFDARQVIDNLRSQVQPQSAR